MEDAFAHCEQLVRQADKDRFFAALFAPAGRRRQLLALYAFNVEVARVRERISEPLAGEVRMQWWRDVIAGERAAEAPSHPVAAALVQTIVRSRLPLPPLLGLIEARCFDLYDEPMQTLAQLEDYAARTSSSLLELAALILGDASDAVARAAAPAGMAYGICGLLRAFPLHAARGQVYIPRDVLDRHGARRENILAGRDTPELRYAFAEMRDYAAAHLQEYAQVRAALPAAVLPAFLPVALVRSYLDRLERSEPFTLADVAQWRRQWLLWRAARRPP
jgi:phytoene synthase